MGGGRGGSRTFPSPHSQESTFPPHIWHPQAGWALNGLPGRVPYLNESPQQDPTLISPQQPLGQNTQTWENRFSEHLCREEQKPGKLPQAQRRGLC